MNVDMPHDPVVVFVGDEPIDIVSFRKLISDADVGAHAWFEGVTRRTTGNLKTEKLCYAAFRPMAVTQLKIIGDESLVRFGLTKIVIAHRLGVVPIGEASLMVGCSAAHRETVFAALAEIVDRIKVDVPIWKKEFFVGGNQHWVHPT